MTKEIEEVMRDAEKAEEPGDFAKAQVISKGDEEIPSTVASELKSAGYVYIYDTVTREGNLCNRNMLAQHLKKQRADGTFVFTTDKPATGPNRGKLKCLLHPDGPDRGHYDELGLPTCRKSNLRSPFQVMRHMQKRHHVEWETLEQERTEREKQEDRAFQRAVMNQVTKPVQEVEEEIEEEEPVRELYVSDKDKAKQGKE